MKIAKGLLEDEFSIALGIPKEDVESYIIDKLNKNTESTIFDKE